MRLKDVVMGMAVMLVILMLVVFAMFWCLENPESITRLTDGTAAYAGLVWEWMLKIAAYPAFVFCTGFFLTMGGMSGLYVIRFIEKAFRGLFGREK